VPGRYGLHVFQSMNVHLCVTQELRDLFSLKSEEVGASEPISEMVSTSSNA